MSCGKKFRGKADKAGFYFLKTHANIPLKKKEKKTLCVIRTLHCVIICGGKVMTAFNLGTFGHQVKSNQSVVSFE